MLLHAFVATSWANGPGRRAVVYFQGCTLNCSACWNPETHKFRGCEVGVRAIVDLFEQACQSQPLEGVTFSGGEPMQQAEALLALMQEFRNAAPAVSLGMFTGYTECELTSGEYLTRPKTTVDRKTALWREIRGLLDFAIMGRYDQTQPATEPLQTSRNQRLVLFSDRYQVGDFGPQLVEVTIGHQGRAVVSGFPVLGVPI